MWEPSLILSDFKFILRGGLIKIDFNSKDMGAKEGFLLSYHLDPSMIKFQANSVITEWSDIETLLELQHISVCSILPDVRADSFLEFWKSSSSTKGETYLI